MIYEPSQGEHKNPKVNFEPYLYSPGEPWDDVSNDLPPKLMAELLENSYLMKRHVKHMARRIKKRYI